MSGKWRGMCEACDQTRKTQPTSEHRTVRGARIGGPLQTRRVKTVEQQRQPGVEVERGVGETGAAPIGEASRGGAGAEEKGTQVSRNPCQAMATCASDSTGAAENAGSGTRKQRAVGGKTRKRSNARKRSGARWRVNCSGNPGPDKYQ